MSRLLTARFVETVKPLAKLKEYPDSSGVRLVVYPSGHKSFVHRYRASRTDRKITKDTLGPANGEGAITLAAAREAVARVRRQLEQGATILRPVLASSDDSVAAQAAEFLARHHQARNRPRTIWNVTHNFNTYVLPSWGKRAVQDIRRRDVITLVEKVMAERGPQAAERALKTLSTFFKWLMTRDVIEASPCSGVFGLLPPSSPPRLRTLNHQTELGPLLKATDTEFPIDRAVAVLIYTAQRRTEVGQMTWSELDPATRMWTIPAARAKNGREHRVPLSTQAWAIIDAQPRFANCGFVFSAYGRGPITGWGIVKDRLTDRTGIEWASWRLHDLRRTAAAGMQRLGIRTEVIERLLNHHSGSFAGIVGIYQVDMLEDEVRAALQTWGDYVEGLLVPMTASKRRAGERPTRVVPLRPSK